VDAFLFEFGVPFEPPPVHACDMTSHRLRAIALAEWRGLPATPFVTDTARPVGEAVIKLMAQLGLKDRLREDEVLGAWREIVGEFVANHSAPQRLKDGVLLVRVLQPTVHYELDRIWKREILEKLKKRFGARTVREIKFRIG
jgi:predicted nucleic acid-binding Zn ribbon protein